MFELSSHCIRDLVDVFTFEPNTKRTTSRKNNALHLLAFML